MTYESKLPLFLLLIASEAAFFVRHGQMDGLHRKFREGVSPSNRPPERPRVAGVHVAISDARSEFVAVF